MYPNDQVLSLFGNEITWPGLHPGTGKFTNGSFTNPDILPSLIPAETLNLILDNLGSLITYLGGAPNNIDPEQLKNAFFAMRPIGVYVSYSYPPSVAEMIQRRLLPLEYQLIEIALYQDLCDRKYVGDALNETADWWYRCDAAGARTVNGLFMRVEDPRGLFMRVAGQNAIKTAADGTHYDGGTPGSYEDGKLLAHTHSFQSKRFTPGGGGHQIHIFWTSDGSGGNGAIYDMDYTGGNESAPTRISEILVITY
jgi:hypothetical protein